MSGYSKIRIVMNNSSPSSNPRSKESPPLSFPPSPPHHHVEEPTPTYKEKGLGDHGDGNGVVLSRSCSTASQRFKPAEKGHGGGVQSMVRRALSMRKTSSSAASTYGYWRIHDDKDGEKEGNQEVTSERKKRGRIYRAWKRLFSF